MLRWMKAKTKPDFEIFNLQGKLFFKIYFAFIKFMYVRRLLQ